MTETSALLLQSELVQRFGWGLLHSLWQIAALAGLYYLVRLAIAKRSLTLRYNLGYAVLLLMLALPIATATLWSVDNQSRDGHGAVEEGLLADVPLDDSRGSDGEHATASTGTPFDFSLPAFSSGDFTSQTGVVSMAEFIDIVGEDAVAEAFLAAENQSRDGHGAVEESLPADVPLDDSRGSDDGNSKLAFTRYLWVLPPLWLAGVIVLSLRLACGLLGIGRLRRSARPPVDDHWPDRLAELCRSLQMRQNVQLLVKRAIDSPVLIGLFRPAVLVPLSFLTGFTPEEVEAVLVHELAHVRRRDYLANLVQMVVETLLFYHPMLWLVSNAVREDREYICDEFVVRRHGTDSIFYAKTLTHLEQFRQTGGNDMKRTLATPAAAARPLLNRVRHILGLKKESDRTCGGMAGLTLLILLLLSPLCFALLDNETAENKEPEVERSATSGQLAEPVDAAVADDSAMADFSLADAPGQEENAAMFAVENTPNQREATPQNLRVRSNLWVENTPNQREATPVVTYRGSRHPVENTSNQREATPVGNYRGIGDTVENTSNQREATPGVYGGNEYTQEEVTPSVYGGNEYNEYMMVENTPKQVNDTRSQQRASDSITRDPNIGTVGVYSSSTQAAVWDPDLQQQFNIPVTGKLYLLENALQLFELENFHDYLQQRIQPLATWHKSSFQPTKRNAILVTGTQQVHEEMQKIMTEIDAIVESEEFKASREMNVAEKPVIKVFKIEHTMAHSLLAMFQSLQIDPDMLLSADAPTNSVLVKASSETLKIVEDLITQLDTEPVLGANPRNQFYSYGYAGVPNPPVATMPGTGMVPAAVSVNPTMPMPGGAPSSAPAFSVTPAQPSIQAIPSASPPYIQVIPPTAGSARTVEPGNRTTTPAPGTSQYTPPSGTRTQTAPLYQSRPGSAAPQAQPNEPRGTYSTTPQVAPQTGSALPVITPDPRVRFMNAQPTPPTAPTLQLQQATPTPTAAIIDTSDGVRVLVTRQVQEVTPEGVTIERVVTEEVPIESIRVNPQPVTPTEPASYTPGFSYEAPPAEAVDEEQEQTRER